MRQSPQARKDELLHALIEARRNVIVAVESLPMTERDRPFLGVWSAHDLVSHLIGWDYTNRDAARAVLEGRLPDVYGHYDADWRTYNAGLVKQHKQEVISETLEAAQTSHEALVAFITAISPDDIRRDYGVRSPGRRRVTVEMLILAETHDELKHAQQIREFAATLCAP